MSRLASFYVVVMTPAIPDESCRLALRRFANGESGLLTQWFRRTGEGTTAAGDLSNLAIVRALALVYGRRGLRFLAQQKLTKVLERDLEELLGASRARHIAGLIARAVDPDDAGVAQGAALDRAQGVATGLAIVPENRVEPQFGRSSAAAPSLEPVGLDIKEREVLWIRRLLVPASIGILSLSALAIAGKISLPRAPFESAAPSKSIAPGSAPHGGAVMDRTKAPPRLPVPPLGLGPNPSKLSRPGTSKEPLHPKAVAASPASGPAHAGDHGAALAPPLVQGGPALSGSSRPPEARQGSLARPYSREEAPSAAKAIVVDLSAHRINVYEDGALIRVMTACSFGRRGHATPEIRDGALSIVRRERLHVSHRYDAAMPYALFLEQAPNIAFHAGNVHQSSHGCIHLTRREAAWLFQWAAKDPVAVTISRRASPPHVEQTIGQ